MVFEDVSSLFGCFFFLGFLRIMYMCMKVEEIEYF